MPRELNPYLQPKAPPLELEAGSEHALKLQTVVQKKLTSILGSFTGASRRNILPARRGARAQGRRNRAIDRRSCMFL